LRQIKDGTGRPVDPAAMRTNLILRYADARVPRYTSYPTAPQFTPAVGEGEYRAWLAAVPAAATASLYLHVPFCQSMCWYCGCHTKVAARDAPVQAYLAQLEREIALVAAALPAGVRVGHIHWGGGTPTIAGPEGFRRLMRHLRERFRLAAAEVAVEADPRALPPDMVEALAEAGVTRVSLGVQSFDAKVQASINRVQDFGAVLHSVVALRRAGIPGLNLDLMYGLPDQTAAGCAETAGLAAALRPDRLAVFGYAHVPWMKPHQRLIDEAALPDAAARLDQFAAIAARLAAHGYRAVGLDHFARPEDGLARALAAGRLRRNFQGYTDDASDALIGLGASAIGTLAEGYVQNTPSLNEYARRVEAGRLGTARGLRLSPEDRLRREVIERIMCTQRVDLAAVAHRHGFPDEVFARERETLARLAEEGVVRLDGPVVALAPDCRLLMRTVAAVFDAYLAQGAGRHARAV
jgi:oxygen-independent coproporphyrinogen-3 oxidase